MESAGIVRDLSLVLVQSRFLPFNFGSVSCDFLVDRILGFGLRLLSMSPPALIMEDPKAKAPAPAPADHPHSQASVEARFVVFCKVVTFFFLFSYVAFGLRIWWRTKKNYFFPLIFPHKFLPKSLIQTALIYILVDPFRLILGICSLFL